MRYVRRVYPMNKILAATSLPLLVLAAGCGGAPAPAATTAPTPAPAQTEAAKPAKPPIDMVALMKRELPPGPKVALEAGSVTGQIEATAPPTVEVKPGITSIDFTFGAENHAKCFLYSQMDPAGTLSKALRGLPSDQLTLRAVAPSAVVAVGDDPAMFVLATYSVHQDGGEALGVLKMMVLASLTTPMFCLHDEPGYEETFKRVTTDLAASLKPTTPTVAFKYVSIRVARVGDVPIGFEREVSGVDAKQNLFYLTTGTVFAPTSPTEYVSQDMARVDNEDGHGGVMGVTYSGGDTQVESQKSVEVKRVGPSEYTYEGTDGGKKISGKFKTKNPRGLRSEAEKTAVLRELVGGKPASGQVHFEEYDPDTSLTGTVDELEHLLSKADRKLESSTNGKTVWTGTVDDQGRELNGVVGEKGAVSVERIFVRGSL
jgi:hypothetical protein